MSDSESENETEFYAEEYDYDVDEIANGDGVAECLVCGKSHRRYHGWAVCSDCAYQKLTITKTNAKKTYRLNDDDLADMYHYTYRTAHGSRGCIYLLKQVRLRFIEKTQNISNPSQQVYQQIVSEHLDSISRRKNRRQESLKAKMEQRARLMTRLEAYMLRHDLVLKHDSSVVESYLKGKCEMQDVIDRAEVWTKNAKRRDRRTSRLQRALQARGLELREDSFYCRRYINDGLDDDSECESEADDDRHFSLQEVVDMMEIMQFFANQTDYFAILRQMVQRRYDNQKELGYWNGERIEASEKMKNRAKIQALKQFQRRKDAEPIPDIVRSQFASHIKR